MSTTVKWIQGKQFIGVDSTNHSVVLSSPAEGIGIKPSELLPIALASCSAVDVVEILSKKRMPLTSLEITTTYEQESEAPWTFIRFNLHFKLSGNDLTEKAVAQAIELSEQKYCSVAATVRGKAEVITSFEIVQND
jgi:putative redox protein